MFHTKHQFLRKETFKLLCKLKQNYILFNWIRKKHPTVTQWYIKTFSKPYQWKELEPKQYFYGFMAPFIGIRYRG